VLDDRSLVKLDLPEVLDKAASWQSRFAATQVGAAA
jgi:hypothetical protein